MENLLVGVGGALLVIALVSSAVSLWLHRRAESPAELTSQVRQLGLDVSELYDKVEHWTRRERVRRFREGQGADQPATPPTVADRKAALRARAAALRTGGMNS